MKDLKEYLYNLLEDNVGAQTPSNTIGMGEPGIDNEPLISAPAGGIPKGKTKITRRRKTRRKDPRDFIMNGDIHNS